MASTLPPLQLQSYFGHYQLPGPILYDSSQYMLLFVYRSVGSVYDVQRNVSLVPVTQFPFGTRRCVLFLHFLADFVALHSSSLVVVVIITGLLNFSNL